MVNSRGYWTRSDIAIVLYHDIAEPVHSLAGHLDVSISPDTFRQHIRYLAKNYDLISATELFSGRLPRKPVLITFDDAYRSVLDYGAVILKEVNAPAVFFVSSATAVAHSVPLDNVLSLAVQELGIKRVLGSVGLENHGIRSARELIAAVVPALNVRDVEQMKEKLFLALGATEAQVYDGSRTFLGARDLAEFGKYRIEIGNHSMHHVYFRGLTSAELHREICENRELLASLSGQPVRCLGIPYGSELDATETVLGMARASGHRGIFLVHGRSNRFRPAADMYYRVDAGNGPARTLWRKLQVEPLLRTVRDAVWRSSGLASADRERSPAGRASYRRTGAASH